MSAPTDRHRRLLIAVTALLTGAAVFLLWRHGGIMPTPPQRLYVDQTVDEELKGGQSRSYLIVLEQDHFLDLVVEQRGIDVKLVFDGPGRERPIEIDSPNGAYGPERLVIVAEGSGDHRLDVVSGNEKAKPGRFLLTLPPSRVATEADRRRAEAHEVFAEGEALRRERTAETHRGAVEKYRRAIALWEELGDEPEQAQALNRLGRVHADLRQDDQAFELYERARTLHQQLGDPVEAARVLNLIGSLRRRRGETAQAHDAFRDARDAARQAEDRGTEAAALTNLANVHKTRGEYQAALDHYRAALEIWQELDLPLEEATTLQSMGNLLIQQGKLEEAADILEQSLAQRRSFGDERPDYTVPTLNQLGFVYQRLGRIEEAFEMLNQALEQRRAQGHEHQVALALNSLGVAHRESGQPRQALGYFEQALDKLAAVKAPGDEATVLANAGRAHLELQAPREAAALFARATQLFHATGDPRGEASAHYGSAWALREIGDLEGALGHLDTALALVEDLRTSSPSQDLRISFFATKQQYFDMKIAVLMQLAADPQATGAASHVEEAIKTVEQRRARALLDVLGENRTGLRHRVDQQLLDQERELEDELNRIEKSLRALRYGIPATESEDREELVRRQNMLVVDLGVVRGRIREQSPSYAELVRPGLLTVQEIQQRVVGRQTLLLIYSLGEKQSFLWLIPKDGQATSYPLGHGRREIEDAVLAAREILVTPSDWAEPRRRRILDDLSRLLLEPVKDKLERNRLVFIVEGALQTLPFAALPEPSAGEDEEDPQPLISRHEIVYLPSASVLATMREELGDRLQAARKIAIIADPVYNPRDERFSTAAPGTEPAPAEHRDLERTFTDVGLELKRLPYSGVEAQAIAEMVPGEQRRLLALGFDANRQTVLQEKLNRYRILHFATHGVLNTRRPELAGLVLSLYDRDKQSLDDGFLYAHEIYKLDLRAELAVLSACQTGLGKDVRGEGTIGLPRGFMYAGVPRVVVSLWQVSDQSTAELMKRFYERMLECRYPPSAALRAAQISMLQEEEWSEPYHWAAFVFQGEWRLDVSNEDDPPIEEIEHGTEVEDPPVIDPDLPGRPPARSTAGRGGS